MAVIAVPQRHAARLLLVAAGGMCLDAVAAFVRRVPAGSGQSRQVMDYLRTEATSEAAWTAAGNLVGAVAAGLAAWWLWRGRAAARSLAVTVVTGFLLYRFTVLFDLTADLASGTPRPAWVTGVRFGLALVVLPALAAVLWFLSDRGLTRVERHRALIGAGDGPEPPGVRTLATLLFWYGAGWLLLPVVAFAAFLAWSGDGGVPGATAVARAIGSGTLGCLGGVALTGCAVAVWLGYTRGITWYVTVGLASVQLSASVAVFMWESVPVPGADWAAGGMTAWLAQLTNLVAFAHILLLSVAVALLWSRRVSGYFRSRP
ncbi:hypothetical protein LX16_5122 [Stackebrandtia albiflava]|uniref:Uncharacterized protein n=1 Tax=Stackebrandtia albiflava TaxID=406432 RepID=A0A562UPW6_9ACTN|nr:hypothetical protein [Stackebrandtia albiflava]TWJ07636.1 hypothetical protein LX16_5122 [Stackebrandtia albiflava]